MVICSPSYVPYHTFTAIRSLSCIHCHAFTNKVERPPPAMPPLRLCTHRRSVKATHKCRGKKCQNTKLVETRTCTTDCKTSCAAGKYTKDDGKTCTTCPAGKAAAALSNKCFHKECTACPYGTYAAKRGQESCTKCAKGRWLSETGTAQTGACIACSAGTYNDIEGAPLARSCINCAVGKWAAAEANACIACVDGKSVAVGPAGKLATDCAACGAGTYAKASAPATCKACPKGRTSDKAGQATCLACPSGKYKSTNGGGKCTACPLGKFCQSPGCASCDGTCGKGQQVSFNNDGGATGCEKCPSGRYQSAQGTHRCDECERGGAYNSESGMQGADKACGKCPMKALGEMCTAPYGRRVGGNAEKSWKKPVGVQSGSPACMADSQCKSSSFPHCIQGRCTKEQPKHCACECSNDKIFAGPYVYSV